MIDLSNEAKHRLKIVFFPVMFMLRMIRRYRVGPRVVARRLFAYDCKRFVNQAGCFHSKTREANLARIIMAYHVLEKGITMPHRHLDFGHVAVLELITLVEDFEGRFGCDEQQVKHAIGCIKEYFSIHLANNFDMSKDRLYWNKIETFCCTHEKIPIAQQIKTTRDAYYKYNEDSFPAFARSRHTVRYYEGVVEMNRVKSAIELAMTAPSACNRQYVKVYCVSSHKIRDQILSLQNGNRGFGLDADKLLVITVDLNGARWAEERNDLYTNAGIFIMNLCYSLHYHKIAHCVLNWSVSPINDQKGHQVLGIDNNEAIVMLLSCGNAPSDFMIASSPRKSLRDIFVEVK